QNLARGFHAGAETWRRNISLPREHDNLRRFAYHLLPLRLLVLRENCQQLLPSLGLFGAIHSQRGRRASSLSCHRPATVFKNRADAHFLVRSKLQRRYYFRVAEGIGAPLLHHQLAEPLCLVGAEDTIELFFLVVDQSQQLLVASLIGLGNGFLHK